MPIIYNNRWFKNITNQLNPLWTTNQQYNFRIAYVSCDLGMMGQLIKMEVLEKLNKEFGNSTFRNDNLVLSATHTHSGPAGYMEYIMYSISSFGFVEECFQVSNLYICQLFCIVNFLLSFLSSFLSSLKGGEISSYGWFNPLLLRWMLNTWKTIITKIHLRYWILSILHYENAFIDS